MRPVVTTLSFLVLSMIMTMNSKPCLVPNLITELGSIVFPLLNSHTTCHVFVPRPQLSEVEGHCLCDDVCYCELQARQAMMGCLKTEAEGARSSTSPMRSKRDVRSYVHLQPAIYRWPLSIPYAIHPAITGKMEES